MAYPTDQAVIGELIGAAQLNRWCMQLANEKLAAADADIDFTSIPAHWSHLLIVVSGQTDNVAVQDLRLRFNNDTAANYDMQQVKGTGSTASATERLAQTSIAVGNVPTNGAGLLGQAFIVVLDYASTTLHKSVLATDGFKVGTASGDLFVFARAAWWRATTAINRVTLLSAASNLAAGSRATLYGMGRI